MSERSFACWRCGAALAADALPIGRRDECPECRADLHVCKMCLYWDPTVSGECSEPVADHVADKEHANFCGYFDAAAGRGARAGSPEAEAARAKLEAMFGVAPDAPEGTPAEADAAQRELRRMFGIDEDGER